LHSLLSGTPVRDGAQSRDKWQRATTEIASMPIIKILDPGGPKQESVQGSYLAAAVMAAALSRVSEPINATAKSPQRTRAEKTRRGNPNRLSVNQHVFPLKSTERFTQGGRVSVSLKARTKVMSLKPNDALFCAHRAWDQRAEAGYMKRIEDEFQTVVAPIIDGKVETIATKQKPAVDRMFALWYLRARYRELEQQEVQLKGVTGNALTKEQEENLEQNCYLFVRRGGTMPARLLNGVQLQQRIGAYARELAADVTRWGVISAQSGEFIVPDVPSQWIIPLSPHLALVGSAPDGVIVEQNLAEINRAARDASQVYFFARDFSACYV